SRKRKPSPRGAPARQAGPRVPRGPGVPRAPSGFGRASPHTSGAQRAARIRPAAFLSPPPLAGEGERSERREDRPGEASSWDAKQRCPLPPHSLRSFGTLSRKQAGEGEERERGEGKGARERVRRAELSRSAPRCNPIRQRAPMNEEVRRSEQSVFGIRLTDAQPLSGIPAVWRLGAIVSTLVMGFLALIAALYFGRPILLPVTAALIVGITLSPATEFGVKYKIPTAVSAIAVVALLV